MWCRHGLRINRHLFIGFYFRLDGRGARGASRVIDRSKVPQLVESDLEEHFISGSGPGGQKVNKSTNCCQLKHKPTGMVVKVHQQRSLEKNRKIARELMIKRLDSLYNGEESVESQEKRIALTRLEKREEQQKQRRLIKEQFKKTLMEQESYDNENKSSPVVDKK